MKLKEKAIEVISRFSSMYPDAKCSLDYSNPLQLLVAAQLSAQCTDERVNKVSKDLFKKYLSVKDYAEAEFEEFANDIRPTGFFNNKAKNIIGCCNMLINEFSGEIPGDMDNLTRLPGIGRKTANLLLGEIFGKPALVIDTHARRVSGRIGLSKNTDPEKIEYDLMKIIPENEQTMFSHRTVYHGRQICVARKPKCEICGVNSVCDYYRQSESK